MLKRISKLLFEQWYGFCTILSSTLLSGFLLMKGNVTMDDAIFESKLNELVKEIGSIPAPEQKKLIMLARKTHDSHKKLKKNVSSLQESLDYLRVSIKYLLFDLEATRRENTYLKKILEDKKK